MTSQQRLKKQIIKRRTEKRSYKKVIRKFAIRQIYKCFFMIEANTYSANYASEKKLWGQIRTFAHELLEDKRISIGAWK